MSDDLLSTILATLSTVALACIILRAKKHVEKASGDEAKTAAHASARRDIRVSFAVVAVLCFGVIIYTAFGTGQSWRQGFYVSLLALAVILAGTAKRWLRARK